MHLNLLSFEPVSDTITMNFYTEKVEKTRPQIVYKDECPELCVYINSKVYHLLIEKYTSNFTKRNKFSFVKNDYHVYQTRNYFTELPIR